MTKVDSFKDFVRKNPSLINYIKSGKNKWQDFYELYDLYGDDSGIWNKYLASGDTKSTGSNTLGSLLDTMKNLDTDKLQDGLTSVQKAIDLFGGLITKDKTDTGSYNPRPVYKRFDD